MNLLETFQTYLKSEIKYKLEDIIYLDLLRVWFLVADHCIMSKVVVQVYAQLSKICTF